MQNARGWKDTWPNGWMDQHNTPQRMEGKDNEDCGRRQQTTDTMVNMYKRPVVQLVYIHAYFIALLWSALRLPSLS